MRSMRSLLYIATCIAVTGTVVCGTSYAQHDYKVSRKWIRSGDYDKAVEVLDAQIAKYPGDCEWHYQLAIARAQKGKLDAAVAALQQALKLGTPVSRFATDSRDLLKPLRELPAMGAILNQQRLSPTQGPMVGAVSDTSAKIWLRTFDPIEVEVRCQAKNGNSQSVAKTKTAAAEDLTAELLVGDLQPSTDYTYSVILDGVEVKFPYPLTFRTAPPDGEPLKYSFAFGGGAGYVTPHERMWTTIAAAHPDAMLMLGDNMYSDDPQSSQMQRYCYYRRQSPPEFRELVARTAVYSIWDDHDFGTNDCSGGPEIDKPAWKPEVWKVYRQNWANPGYGGGPQQPGCWYDFHVGDLHFIMLDGRYYRHPAGKTMLGPVQMAWLKETLAGSTATFKFLASPVPWEYRTKGDSKDTWNGFKEERTEIFDFLAEHKIEGVVLISADRHRSDAWKVERPNSYALYEFNSSRLTNNHVHGEMKEAIFSYNKKQSFGLVEVDTTAADPTVKYTVINIDGEQMHDLTLRRSQLK